MREEEREGGEGEREEGEMGGKGGKGGKGVRKQGELEREKGVGDERVGRCEEE